MGCREVFTQWRNWIRPLVIALYVVILVIALPLLIIELNLHGAEAHTQAWLIGGIFVVLAIPISLWGILQHMIHYTQPDLQRYIIRILWMVPIYAMDAWLALRFKDAAIYLDTLRECYEAYVVYNFMAYLLTFLNSQYPDLEAELESKPQVKHLVPFCCFPPWKMGRPLIQHCRHGVLQYTVIRPLTTIIALICQKLHVYKEGDFNFKSAWSYLAIINNISQVGAMYCLVLFYVATKEHLAPIKPVGKFLCIKAIVFMTFWQSVLIAVLVKVGVIRDVWGFQVEEVATGLQDFIICVEMLFAAIGHYLSFSHIPFIEEGGTQGDCCASFAAMWDVSDVRADVVDHVRHVGKSVTRTLRRNPASQNERTPLLVDGGETSYSQTSMPNATDFAGVGYLGSRSGSIGTINSLDASVTDTLQSRSLTASMNNFMDLSESTHAEVTDQPKDTVTKQEPLSSGQTTADIAVTGGAGLLIDFSTPQQSEPLAPDSEPPASKSEPPAPNSEPPVPYNESPAPHSEVSVKDSQPSKENASDTLSGNDLQDSAQGGDSPLGAIKDTHVENTGIIDTPQTHQSSNASNVENV